MSGNSPLKLYVAIALTVAALSMDAAAAPQKSIKRKAPAADTCAAVSPASSLESKTRCAREIVAATRGDDRATAAILAQKLGADESRLLVGLRRSATRGTPREWRNLSADELASILRAASEEERGGEHAQTREEYQRFVLGDENGIIPPDGLARALRERQAIIDQRHELVRSQYVAQPSSAGLPSTPAGWTNLTGYVHPVGRVNDLLIHPTTTTTMWAGTDGGGIWKTTDGGATWTPINDFLGSLSISSFAMRPGDTSTIYVATGAMGSHTGTGGDGIFKSTDGGVTFTQLAATDPATNSDFNYVNQIAIHPTDSNTVLAATWNGSTSTGGGAYITTNGGTTWTKIAAASTRANSVAFHRSNGNLRVIGMHDGTVKIATDGTTYNSYTIASSTASYTHIALAPSDQNVMYAQVRNTGAANATQLYRSTTGGTTWTQITTDSLDIRSQLFYTGGLWVDPTNANHIACVEFWADVTLDASVASPTWKSLAGGWVDFHGAVSDPGYNGTTNRKVYFFDDGGLYRYDDVDTVDTTYPAYLSPNGINATEAYTAAGRGGNLIFGAQDVASRYYKTASGDATQKWRFASGLGGHDGAATAADRTNINILYGSTQYLGIHRSSDGGGTTGFICTGITDINCSSYSGKSLFIAPFVLDPNNQNTMLAGAMSLWRSTDVSTSATWSAIHTGVGSAPGGTWNGIGVSAIAVAPSDSATIWIAYNNGSVYKTANGTATTPAWTQVTTVPSGSKLRILIDRTNSSHVWIGLSGFLANRLVVTPDGGTTWSNVAGLPSASVMSLQQHPSNASWLYAGTAVGLFASADGGTTWSASNEGPANVQVRDLQWYSDSPAVLLAGTFGRGVWKATISSTSPPAAPSGLLADPVSTTSVQLTWNAVSGATGYKILRSTLLPTFVQVGTSTGNSYTDTVSASTAYLYVVRATNAGGDSGDSNRDIAITMGYTDPTITVGVTPVKVVHLEEVRTAVNKFTDLVGMPRTTFTDPVLTTSTTVKAAHFLELRTAINQARTNAGLITYLFGETFGETLTPGVSLIKAYHINELRLSMK